VIALLLDTIDRTRKGAEVKRPFQIGLVTPVVLGLAVISASAAPFAPPAAPVEAVSTVEQVKHRRHHHEHYHRHYH
jgi:hypothetical protein